MWVEFYIVLYMYIVYVLLVTVMLCVMDGLTLSGCWWTLLPFRATPDQCGQNPSEVSEGLPKWESNTALEVDILLCK